MIRKSLSQVKVEGDQGEIEAVFATLNVVDHDGDVILPGAFEEGQKVRISAYNHASWGDALPVGKGTIHEVGNQAVFRGRFFMANQIARETFETVKELEDLAEYSFGFDVLDSERGSFEGERVQFLRKLKVHEVSPVLLGAGIGTGTLAVKSRLAATDLAELKRIRASLEAAEIKAQFEERNRRTELRALMPDSLLFRERTRKVRGDVTYIGPVVQSDPGIRKAAELGIDLASRALGVARPRVAWFAEKGTVRPTADTVEFTGNAMGGFAHPGSPPFIGLNATSLDTRLRALEVGAHEMFHIARPDAPEERALSYGRRLVGLE
jgi:HK97 family phage prohead protease